MLFRGFIKDILVFNRRERNGILLLLCFLFLLVMLYAAIPRLVAPVSYEADSSDIARLFNQLNDIRFENDNIPELREYAYDHSGYSLFSFDPNTATHDDLSKLGLKKYVVDNILRYREKGGIFKSNSDFRKIYGLSPEKYDELVIYININNKQPKQPDISKIETTPVFINLNTCTKNDLTQLGPLDQELSSRIVKYRSLLGGYFSISQLNEIYGLDSVVIADIREFLTVDKGQIKKMMINHATLNELSRHPYISKYMAMSVNQYIKSGKKLTSVDDMVMNKITDRETAEKRHYYIDFQ